MTELLVFSAPTRRALAEGVAAGAAAAVSEPLPALARRLAQLPAAPFRLAVLAEDRADLEAKLGKAREALDGDRQRFNLANRLFFDRAETGRKLAFLFPGYGARQPNLLGEPYARFPAVRSWVDALAPEDLVRYRRNHRLFSDPGTAPAKGSARDVSLGRITDAALVADLAYHALLRHLGLSCDAGAGHSYGEAALLVAAGMVADVRPVAALLRRVVRAPRGGPEVASALLAVTGASRRALAPLLEGLPVFLALDNCPQQAILCGEAAAIARLEEALQARRELSFRLPRLEQGVHTPLFPVPPERLGEIYAEIEVRPPAWPAYSCATAAPFPGRPEAIRELLARQWSAPVRFRETVERLHADGIRTFVEVGPGGHLSGFVRDTLRGKEVAVVPTHRDDADPVLQLRLCLAQLFVLGHPFDLARALELAPEAGVAEPAWIVAAPPAEAPSPALAAGGREIADLVLREVAAVLGLSGVELIDPQRGFFELGLGSLGSLELALRLGRSLGRELPPTVAFDYPSPARLAEYLSAPEGSRAPAAPGPAAAPALAAGGETGPEPIAVVGVGCRFPGGADTPEAFWELLLAGRDAVGEAPPGRLEDGGKLARRAGKWLHGGYLDGVDRFDAAFFGISPREAVALDPQQRLLLEVTWEALERAAIAPAELAETATGVFVGIGSGDYAQRLTPRQRLEVGGYMGTGNAHSTAAGRISHAFGLTGPCLAVDTACSSSLVAVHLACRSLRERESDVALAGGVNLVLSAETSAYLAAARALSPSGRCRTFAAAADGYVRADGCGMVVLERWRDAVAAGHPVLAVILGTAVNHDGHTSGLTVPSGPAQQAVVRRALADAGVAPEEVGYLEAHGTGTPLGDPIEVAALGQVFAGGPREEPLLLGSVKTNFGHAEAAAGIAALIKVVLQLRARRIAPSLHFAAPSPKVDWAGLPFRVVTGAEEWTNGRHPLTAGVSSSGMSGTNAHAVLREAPRSMELGAEPETPGGRPHLLTLSARSAAALAELAVRYAAHLRLEPPGADLRSIATTSNLGRAHFPHRLAIVAGSREEALARLDEGPRGAAASPGGRPRLAFLFTGQGAQVPGAGGGLFAGEPAFGAALEECDALLRPLLEVPLLDVLYREPSRRPLLERAAYAQPALFALEVALARLWRSWGIEPDAVLGHSLGEYAAACVAGVLGLEDGLRLVAARGRLMESLPEGGAMLAVAASETEVAERLDPAALGLGLDLELAADNAPRRLVLSGPAPVVRRARELLEAGGLRCSLLPVAYAFHSRLMDPILAPFREAAGGISHRPSRVPLIANLTGRRFAEGVAPADYWTGQLRRTVRFRDGVRALREEGCTLFLELGPKPVLAGLGRDCVAGEPEEESRHWLASLHPPREEREQMLASLGRLYEAGVEVDWRGFHRGRRGRRVALPTYPFQRERYWISSGIASGITSGSETGPEVGIEIGGVEAAPGPVRRSLPEGNGPSPGDLPADLPAALRRAGAAERRERVGEYLRQRACEILLYPRDRPLDLRRPLHDLGFDSILAARFHTRLLADLEVDVPVASFLEDPTLERLAALILERLAAEDSAANGGEKHSAGRAARA